MTSAMVARTSTNTARLFGRSLSLAERGWLPDEVIRMGIRRLCAQRLRESVDLNTFIAEMDAGPIAPVPSKANDQHYELPPSFFQHVLGPHRKYSSCCWDHGVQTLDDAESQALDITCSRADVADGMNILELGCGWGSLTLWMASRFPRSTITAVSNAASQRRFIEAAALERGLTNVRVLTADMNDFDADAGAFDRVVSIEMFEHMRNWRRLLGNISRWLNRDGRLFVHIFAHQRMAYAFETEGEHNWMGRHFFTGGIMPTKDLMRHVQSDMRVEQQWWWNGTHYARTAEAWLANMDARRAAIMPIMRDAYGPHHATQWFHRWRIFFMACAELFNFNRGGEWGVGHYLLGR